MQEFSHSIQIEQRKNITVTGVESVKAFSSTKIELVLIGTSQQLYITGADLKITDFSKIKATFSASGTVDSVRYGNGIKAKLFK